jgi:hypothetical protein
VYRGQTGNKALPDSVLKPHPSDSSRPFPANLPKNLLDDT